MIELTEINAGLRSLALSTPRIATAFIILPLLSREDAPVLVRNAVYFSLALSVAPFLTVSGALPVDATVWMILIAKEVFIGLAIGFLFSAIFWAVTMAGEIIDTKAGASLGVLADPLAGYQISITSAFLLRFASWLFIAFGGLFVFLEVLLGSYVLWPVLSFFPDFNVAGPMFFSKKFGSMMTIALLLAAPVLIVLSTVDFSLGLINRYVPQLNVLPIAMGLKAWLSTAILLLSLSVLIDYFLQSLWASGGVLDLLKAIF